MPWRGGDLMTRQGGFSLVEVLVSLAILSLAGLSGFVLIASLSRAHARIDESYARLERTQILLADFAHDVSSATRVDLSSTGSTLVLGTTDCEGRVEYSFQSGLLVREVPGCPERRFEIGGISDARFSLVETPGRDTLIGPLPEEEVRLMRAVRVDVHFEEQTPGRSFYKIADLPGKRPL